jgi:hypothetical protein
MPDDKEDIIKSSGISDTEGESRPERCIPGMIRYFDGLLEDVHRFTRTDHDG